MTARPVLGTSCARREASGQPGAPCNVATSPMSAAPANWQVMAELAERGWNVGVPEIDLGDDTIVLNDSSGRSRDSTEMHPLRRHPAARRLACAAGGARRPDEPAPFTFVLELAFGPSGSSSRSVAIASRTAACTDTPRRSAASFSASQTDSDSRTECGRVGSLASPRRGRPVLGRMPCAARRCAYALRVPAPKSASGISSMLEREGSS